MRSRTTNRDHRTCTNSGVITATIRSRGGNQGRWIAIQGAKSKRFITHLKRRIWTLHLRSDDRDIFRNDPSWTFHRNRRSKRSDDYDQKPYKKTCSSSFVSIRVEILIQLSCLDSLSLVSLDSILFLSHFRISRGVEVKIWWRIEGEIAA